MCGHKRLGVIQPGRVHHPYGSTCFFRCFLQKPVQSADELQHMGRTDSRQIAFVAEKPFVDIAAADSGVSKSRQPVAEIGISVIFHHFRQQIVHHIKIGGCKNLTAQLRHGSKLAAFILRRRYGRHGNAVFAVLQQVMLPVLLHRFNRPSRSRCGLADLLAASGMGVDKTLCVGQTACVGGKSQVGGDADKVRPGQFVLHICVRLPCHLRGKPPAVFGGGQLAQCAYPVAVAVGEARGDVGGNAHYLPRARVGHFHHFDVGRVVQTAFFAVFDLFGRKGVGVGLDVFGTLAQGLFFGELDDAAQAAVAVGREYLPPQRVFHRQDKVVITFVRLAPLSGHAGQVFEIGQLFLGRLHAHPLSGRVGGLEVGVEDGAQAAGAAQLHGFGHAVDGVEHDRFAPPAARHQIGFELLLKGVPARAVGNRRFHGRLGFGQHVLIHHLCHGEGNGVFVQPDVVVRETGQQLFAFEKVEGGTVDQGVELGFDAFSHCRPILQLSS